MKNLSRKLLIIALALALVLSMASLCYAISPTDEIENYNIDININQDGTAHIKYHFVWRVLESDGIGPVEWLYIGVSNSHIKNLKATSSNIRNIEFIEHDDYGNDGSYVRVEFTKSYYKNTDIDFSFELDQDYLYELNSYNDKVMYYFVPGWFNGVETKSMVVRWYGDKVDSMDSGAIFDNGYYIWESSLGAGEREKFTVYYAKDAYDFDLGKYIDEGGKGDDPGWDDPGYDDDDDWIGGLIGSIFSIGWIAVLIGVISKVKKSYDSGSGFADGATEKKVTRTKVVYYDSCPGCGAERKEGKESCEYCGRSLIKSEEILSEETIKSEDKDALKYKTDGLYSYGGGHNTFVRVNVVHVPVAPSHRPSSSIGGRSGRGGGGGCAHSSCACACASCACACACACAGGGRAGCTTKDFYNTKLKLKQLDLRKPLEK